MALLRANVNEAALPSRVQLIYPFNVYLNVTFGMQQRIIFLGNGFFVQDCEEIGVQLKRLKVRSRRASARAAVVWLAKDSASTFCPMPHYFGHPG